MTRSQSVQVLMASMDIAIRGKEAIRTTTKAFTITAEAVRIITNTRQAVGMAITFPEAKGAMIMKLRASTTIKVNQAGTMNTPGPIDLGHQSVPITAPLMLEMAITKSALRRLGAN